MMLHETIPQLNELSVSEKLLLVEELWDEIAAHHEQLPVSEWHQQELERRYRDYQTDPVSGSQWSEVKARLLKGL